MYLYLSPFEHTHSSDYMKLTEFDPRTELSELKRFIERHHRTWNAQLDFRIERKIEAYDEDNQDEFYILFSTETPYYGGHDWEAEHTDKTNAAWFDRLLENAAHTIVVVPDYYLISVTPWSDNPDDADLLNNTITDVFDALISLSQYPYLDEDAYRAAENEHYQEHIEEVVRDNNLNNAAKGMLWKSEFTMWGPNEVLFHLEEILKKQTNPFWWAKVWRNQDTPRKIVDMVYKKRGIVRFVEGGRWKVHYTLVQSRMPFRVKRTRRLFSERWRGISAKDGKLVWVGKYVV